MIVTARLNVKGHIGIKACLSDDIKNQAGTIDSVLSDMIYQCLGNRYDLKLGELEVELADYKIEDKENE